MSGLKEGFKYGPAKVSKDLGAEILKKIPNYSTTD